jgi:hypothetical protein
LKCCPIGDIGRPGPLATVRDVRREMSSRLSRKVCRGNLPPEAGTKLWFTCSTGSAAWSNWKPFEARLAALERGSDAIDK